MKRTVLLLVLLFGVLELHAQQLITNWKPEMTGKILSGSQVPVVFITFATDDYPEFPKGFVTELKDALEYFKEPVAIILADMPYQEFMTYSKDWENSAMPFNSHGINGALVFYKKWMNDKLVRNGMLKHVDNLGFNPEGVAYLIALNYSVMPNALLLNQEKDQSSQDYYKTIDKLKMMVGELVDESPDNLTEDYPIGDMDELDREELYFRAEKEFNLSIPEDKRQEIYYIQELAEFIYMQTTK